MPTTRSCLPGARPPTVGFRPRKVGRGFTLLEVVAAAAIGLLILGAAASAIAPAGKFLRLRHEHESAEAIARRILDQVEGDLSASVGLAATVQGDQSGIGDSGNPWGHWPQASEPGAKPGAGAGSLRLEPESAPSLWRYGMAGVWLRLIVLHPASSQPDAPGPSPEAVAYQILRTAAGGGSGSSYGLYRSRADARATLRTGWDLAGPVRPGHYNDANTGGTGLEAQRLRRPLASQLLATGVIDFGIRLRERGPDGSWGTRFPLPPRGGLPPVLGATAGLVPGGRCPFLPAGADAVVASPEEVDVLVRVLTPTGRRLLGALESGSPAPGAAWWDLAQAHAETWTRTVRVRGLQ